MQSIQYRRRYVSLMTFAVSIIAAAPTVCFGISRDPAKHWTADNGNGTYSNPLFYEEFEDPDIIRVGDTFYLAGTTMHMNPAVQLMQSKDLVNWELVGYCMDRLDLGPAFRLEDGRGIYGQGIWAPCIRYHNGMFYVFSNVNGVGLQVFRSKSIHGPWERNQLPGRHDLSVLFDDDGKVYIVSGNRNPYPIEELTPDLRSFVPNSRRMMDAPGMGEGHHLYKINGKYYDVSAIPGATTDQMVARADSIDGPWTVERMVRGESLGVTAQTPARASARDPGLTLHQGGIVDTPSGEWWSVIMSDHGSAGRMVALVPIRWDNGFPLIGLPGNLRKAPNTWIKPNTGHTQEPRPAFVHDDNFDSGKLNPEWQWNHVPDDSKWSLTEKPGVLRLHSLPAADFYSARNSLCQRPPGPESIMTVELDTSGMVEGDTAGLALLSSPYAWIGVVKSADATTVQRYTSASRGGSGFRRRDAAAVQENPPVISSVRPPQRLWLRVHCNFDTDEAVFSWSADGSNFTPLGDPFTMTFQLRTFQGVRPALFHYNTSGRAGGWVDFDNYTVEEPRARCIERQIPMGKTITLTSGADGSVLAADFGSMKMVNVAADQAGADTRSTLFEVIDLGKGRVALKAANGRCVSVAGNDVVLKDLAGAKPGNAESFQWVNLMRGDTMLMSLTNHRYLAATPGNPGPVTASATGPNPARKGGACFKWKAVEPADWKDEANARIARLRQRDVHVRVVDEQGKPAVGVQMEIRQVRKAFPFGAAMSRAILRNEQYADFFKAHFNWAVFENESKWYANARLQGRDDYRDADAMLEWCQANNIPVRGHCIFWEPERWQPRWVSELSGDDLRRAVEGRLESAVTHFRGRFVHWDVNNEMLHGTFFKDRLGESIWPWMFKRTHELDPKARLFVNDYNILSVDQAHEQVQTDEYIASIRRLLDQGAPVHGIGIQGHLWHEDVLANPGVLKERLDKLAVLQLPIWISEFDVADDDETSCADKLEVVYRTAYSHPAVEGIMMWVFWAGASWRGPNAGLARRDWTLNEAGKRYEALMKEWSTELSAKTDAGGALSFRGFHGDYEAKVTAGDGTETCAAFAIEKGSDPQEITIQLKSTSAAVAAEPADAASANSADADTTLFPTPLKWKSSGVLISPVSDETHQIVSVKDPTIVRYNDLWHIYATVYSNSARTWSMVYLNFKDWEDAPKAKLHFVDVNPGLRGYHCAPHLFYFRPHKKWYLVFQSQQPQYCTTDDITRPETWTAPRNFFARMPVGAPRLPIDYHIICDDTHAYLFFTGDNGCFYRSRTKIEDFPNGFGEIEIAIQDNRNNLFEGSMTYKIKGTDTWLTIIEALSPTRYYRAWISKDLNGQWIPVPGADSWQTPFAGINNVTFEEGVEPWTREISHGELIREGYDETPTIDLNNLQFLYQGRDPSINTRYDQLPYRLGLLTADRSSK
ncbi:MAG TPA: non-reducing end alpha-L-arabinofuranosidase family hydrolase [Anaerohalosphaeraceae bacterium]|jgi:xylan 1,4-beta-xylosidase|nr:non-reducing end alpha-L-arabinofuranosidase family hydrolase [Anaerohalosphaeraceae bacterium]HRT50874.1 non-reducing end alpha-L-arabinofuranosidase family hydrolase [Anaerohalosphaeraceae bacterium]HRT86856.1 non-reducing end alpha-L-arabinofuranosidase family hydrolase [Anaerohalosphaeraceae bacterium]